MRNIKIGVSLALIALLVIFATQNMATVELKFLDWTMQSRRFVIIGASFAIGFLVGALVAWRR